jgi:hypothetical protein
MDARQTTNAALTLRIGAGRRPADRDRPSLEATMSAPHFASSDHNPSVATRNVPGHSYRELVDRGLTDGEAGALAAYLEGLDVAHHSWTLREVNGLLFLRHLTRTNRLDESDLAR